MKHLRKLLAVALAAFFFATAALAQTSGTVTNHAFALGKGAGATSYTSLLCGSAQLAVGQSAADPICKTITGDVTLSAAGVTAIGATKVTSAMLNADVFSTAHSWAGQQTFVAPILGTPASGVATNLTGTAAGLTAGAVAVGGITGLGTGVPAALAINVGTAGAPVTNGGALGTPSSGVATNLTGTAASLTAGNVTTNANLTGNVTSVGNATTLAAGSAAVLNSGTLLAARMPALTGDCTTSVGAVATTCTKTNNVAFTAGATAAVGQLPGTTTNDNATAGNVGEYIATGSLNGTSTITVTIASPAVVTWTAHGFVNSPIDGNVCTPINFTTTIALPTGLVAGSTYYVIGSTITTNTFQLATSVANCIAGTALNTSGTQSGVHTGINNAAIATGVAKDITGISLTAGDWDVCGLVSSNVAGGTVLSLFYGYVTTVSTANAAVPNNGAVNVFQTTFTAGGNAAQPVGCKRYSLSSTTTIFLGTLMNFTSTNAAYGYLRARRMR